jgi:hypothetical protein
MSQQTPSTPPPRPSTPPASSPALSRPRGGPQEANPRDAPPTCVDDSVYVFITNRNTETPMCHPMLMMQIPSYHLTFRLEGT